MTRRGRARPGFALVELLATITVVAVLGSVSSTLIYAGVHSYRDASAQGQLHEEMSTALEHITRALRGIPADSTMLASIPSVTAVSADSITWGTGSRLWLAGTNLQYQEDGGTASVLLSGVSAFAVQCYDEAGTALAANLNAAASRDVRRIQVQITASANGSTETLRTRVFTRCAMSGSLP